MFKRFFSLLLVLTMAIGFAAPAFAADQPMTIKVGAFNEKFNGSDEKADPNGIDLYKQIQAAQTWLESKDNAKAYTPKSIEAYQAALDAALDLVASYDANPESVSAADMGAKASALKTAVIGLSTDPTEEDLAAIQDAIKAAQKYVDDGKLTVAATNAIKNAIQHAKDEKPATRLEAAKVVTDLNAIVDTNKKLVNEISLSLDKAGYGYEADKPEQGVKADELYYKIKKDDSKQDDSQYVVKIVLNDNDPYYTTKFTKGDAVTTVQTITAATIDSTITEFEVGDKIVVTLCTYTVTPGSDRFHPVETYTPVGDPVNIEVFEEAPKETPAPAPVAKAAGFVAVSKDNEVKDAKIEADNSFYVVASGAIKNVALDTTGKNSPKVDGYYWKITDPNGKALYTSAKMENLDLETADNKVFVVTTDLSKTEADLVAGKYTIELVVYTGEAPDLTAKALLTWTAEIEALDTSEIKAMMDKIDGEMGGATGLDQNYGPYAAVTTLYNTYSGAKDKYFGKTALPATKGYIDELGRVTHKDEDGKEVKGDNFAGQFEEAMDAVYSVVALREKLEEVQALDPADYTNWFTGLMGCGTDGYLYKAAETLAKATNNPKETVKIYGYWDEKKPTEKVEAEIKADFSATVPDEKAVKTALANLTTAVEKLDSLLADVAALQALIESAPADGSKYTAASWKAVQDAITAGKAVIDSKPVKADQKKVDDAVAALQAALKALVVATGDVEKVTEEGKDYIVKDGEKLSGVQEVDGKLYYASVKDNHVLKGGLLTGEAGKKYLAGDDGVLLLGYQKVGDDHYYFAKDGHMLRNGIVTGAAGKQYVAAKDGKLAVGLVTAPNGNDYYCSVKDNHIMKAPKGTKSAPVIGPNGAKYLVNEKGVVIG